MQPLTRSHVFIGGDSNPVADAPTVGDLVAFLSQFPPDLPVMAHWEGLIKGLDLHGIELVDDVDGVPVRSSVTVVLDADF